ncbi:thioredoxin domain-containing protein [Flagellimonas myxillae]|uniref:thioredoxin domain-containing protein n=1 Tax=Flagellimonas myxillae TaxID=2942214 RepID=UPI00201E7E38|nr:thioredoxin domain-containing protein [Muricauda myxillae]MCL6267329.1 thioredoxin domain-containing protein [Muricauda myxillae]
MIKRIILLSVLMPLFSGCTQKSDKVTHKHTNALINETSPYLLQHAHNPVNWEAWRPEVLERAKKEDKPLLISIGYSSCHWCHVMEKECFEDEEVAQMMNENFINIKIDREERPDVDQIYMDAITMMSGNGGWPLNIIALPDGRPFWGATYLPKDNWTKSLKQLVELYQKDKPRIVKYATDIANGINAVNLVENKSDADIFNMEQLDNAVQSWANHFDNFLGGYKRAPKFMMPNNWDFLMHYAQTNNKPELMEQVDVTLTRIAYGGVFDHVGGGFSRYSVDNKWHVPHFEKMLYDNGPLTSLYAKAYAVTKNELYKEVVEQTIAFVQEELLDENGGFYSSLDADSLNENGELVEGAYYVWTKEELSALLGADFEIFQDYYNINSYGLWEHENYVLIRDKDDDEIAKKHDLSVAELKTKMQEALKVLKAERAKRSKPRLDDKVLTSWNGLMLTGLIDAYRYLGDEKYLELALNNASFLESAMIKEDYSLYRNHKDGNSDIDAFLEDYAVLGESFISLYEVTFDAKWLNLAKNLVDYAVTHFSDENSGMFFYTSDADKSLIRRSIETIDKEISSSNSIMAKNLLKLHKLYPDDGYGDRAKQMLKNVQDDFIESAQGFANWMNLVLFENQNFYEIAVVGDNYKELGREISRSYLPNSILVGSQKDGPVDLLKNRYAEGETFVYVCIEGACKLPVQTAEKAVALINN